MGYQEKAVKLDKQVSAAHLKDLQIREKQQQKFQKHIKQGKKKSAFSLVSRPGQKKKKNEVLGVIY